MMRWKNASSTDSASSVSVGVVVETVQLCACIICSVVAVLQFDRNIYNVVAAQTVKHAISRKPFGKPLTAYGLIQVQ